MYVCLCVRGGGHKEHDTADTTVTSDRYTMNAVENEVETRMCEAGVIEHAHDCRRAHACAHVCVSELGGKKEQEQELNVSKLSAATAGAADRQTQTKGWRIICAVSCHAPRECAHGWVGRRREEGVARMLDRSRICIAPLKTARPMAFACRKTHASFPPCSPSPLCSRSLARRPSPLSNPSCSTAGCHTTPTLCCRAAPAPLLQSGSTCVHRTLGRQYYACVNGRKRCALILRWPLLNPTHVIAYLYDGGVVGVGGLFECTVAVVAVLAYLKRHQIGTLLKSNLIVFKKTHFLTYSHLLHKA